MNRTDGIADYLRIGFLLPPRSPLDKATVSNIGSSSVFRFSLSSELLGDALILYWNARATAHLQRQNFELVLGRSQQHGLLGCLPSKVNAGTPYAWQAQEFAKVRDDNTSCLSCDKPASNSKSLWHLIPDMMLEDSTRVLMSIATQAPEVRPCLRTLSAPLGDTLKNIGDPRAVVIYMDCLPLCSDNNCIYSVVAHHFVLERLPSTASEVLIIRNNETNATSSFCSNVVEDLKDYLEVERKRQHLTVSVKVVGEPGTLEEARDWLTLSTATVLFCYPSTFCASAAVANPNSVFLAVNKEFTVVAGPSSTFGDCSRPPLARPGLHWVEVDVLSHVVAREMKWSDMQMFLRSFTCSPYRWKKGGGVSWSVVKIHDCKKGRATKSTTYFAPLGNSLILLWSEVSKAAMAHKDFSLRNANEQNEILRKIGMRPPHYELSDEAVAVSRLAKKSNCGWGGCYHFYEHDLIIRQTQLVVQLMAPSILDANTIRNVEDPCTAVVHIRCGADTMRAPDYGLTPHRFVLNNLPPHITKVLFVGRPFALGEGEEGASYMNGVEKPRNFCALAVKDLKAELERRNLAVSTRSSGSVEADWVVLASAPVLFCWTSTFCATAALGNPGIVFIAVNGKKMSVAAPPSSMGDATLPPLSRPGLHWIEMDMLVIPIPSSYNPSDVQLLEYLRSSECIPQKHRCQKF